MGRRPELADPSHERHPTRASCMFSDTLYFLTMIGVWKVLGAIVILVPGFARLKEWAYAGIFFDLNSAAASHAAVGDYGGHAFHILVTLTLAPLAMSSWALRPQGRILGTLFPSRSASLSQFHTWCIGLSTASAVQLDTEREIGFSH